MNVHLLRPLIHVTDVDASLAFYSLLGFERRADSHDERNRTVWALAASGAAQLMFAQADPAPNPHEQAVLFYMYSHDIAALRERLLAGGLHDGGRFCGGPGPNGGRRVVFATHYPDYMPAGELRIHDPDGYCVLIGDAE